MALFKCKMCGGSLEVIDGATIIECEYCGTQQTLPKTTDENIQNLFNRANLLRQKNEFDKAEALYEKILEADDKEAEAYWGVILCKFGIEYVEDPKTYKRIPTCHRTSYDSIVADEYYKKALEHADITQRSIYESEAKQIDEIQKGILAIATNEEPYDVFICYKETDENGKRTQDSVIANDIYYQLKQEGFKVFYAAITLEGKLGSAYEPIIFAALNSAKVMLVVGSKPEYFNAVWVKNEWSRFLKMIKNDRSKLLIPCYKGMDAYDLPEEFAHLQAQDMSKIGFINDVVRGIKKVIKKDEPKATVVKETVITSGNQPIEPLMKRARMFLEDTDWSSAKEYADKVLDIDPENAEAYLVKYLSQRRIPRAEVMLIDICAGSDDIKKHPDFQKALRFANDELRQKLEGYLKEIDVKYKEYRRQNIYTEAKSKMNRNTYESYLEARQLFISIKDYLDSEALSKKCLERSEGCRKDKTYQEALSKGVEDEISSVSQAIKLFETIPGWRDSDELLVHYKEKLSDLIEAKKQKEKMEKQKAEEKLVKRKKFIKKLKIRAIIVVILVVAYFIVNLIIGSVYSSRLVGKCFYTEDQGEALIYFIDKNTCSISASNADNYSLKNCSYKVSWGIFSVRIGITCKNSLWNSEHIEEFTVRSDTNGNMVIYTNNFFFDGPATFNEIDG